MTRRRARALFIAVVLMLGAAAAHATTRPLTLACPANVTVTAAAGATSALVTYPPATTSGGSGKVRVTYSQGSGTDVPIGTTTVTVSATDATGIVLTCPFTVTVQASTPPVTLAASSTNITAGQSVTLTLATPADVYHNVSLNGQLMTLQGCLSTGCTFMLAVSPTATTTYQSSATDANNTPYPNMPAVTVTVTSVPPPPPPPPSSGLIQASNLVDTGSFDTPDGILGVDPFGSQFYETEFANGSVAFNPANNSLFVVGHDWGQHTAEISIPPVGGTASILQPFVDAEYGKLPLMDPTDGAIEGAKIGGLLVDGAKLLVGGYIYYDGANDAVASHFVRGTNLAVNDVVGPLTVGSMGPAFVGGYFAPVPSEWQAALGGDTLVGQCCLSIITRTSWGPAAFALNTADLEAGKNPTPATPLVYYDQDHPTLGVYDCTGCIDPLYNETTEIHGGFIPPGSSSLLIFGITGMGAVCYGAGTSDPSLAGTIGPTGYPYCYDPPRDGSQGSHAYPYSGYVWAYNLNDLAAVKAGTKQPWEIVPYTTWTLPFGPVGASYDPATGRLFLTQEDTTLRVHVLKLQ